MYESCFEHLASWGTNPRFEAELAAAREDYFDRTGPVHEEDAEFEQRMAGFSEHYLLDRPLGFDSIGRTPARLFLFEHGNELSDVEQRGFRALSHTIHGLFEVRKLRKELVVVRDLFTLEKHHVMERRQVAGMSKGDILEARLVPWEEELLFGRSFVFHPRGARKLILKMVAQIRKSEKVNEPDARRAAIWALAKAALVHSRQQRNNRAVPRVDLIYGNL